MQVAKLKRTSTTSWSPLSFSHNGNMVPLICTGNVSGALDDTFSSASELEIFCMDIDNSMQKLGGVTGNSRFHNLAWSNYTENNPMGIIAAGMEDGHLDLWNANSIVNKQEGKDPLLLRLEAHKGPVSAMDFCFLNKNMLATGGNEASIQLWDMNCPDKLKTPGPKSTRLADISCLAWNKQIDYILATCSSNGVVAIWDLRSRREIIHIVTPGKRPISAIAWDPSSNKKFATASSDDSAPVVYLWNLQNAHDPEKVLSHHSKGVLGLSWCSKDSDLLLSSGKDNKTLCWNPSTGEMTGEFPMSKNWVFDVKWSPLNPDLLMTSSFDGKVSIFSIQPRIGTEEAPLSPVNPNDPFGSILQQQTSLSAFTLRQPPKWLRRTVGARFFPGNRLIVFSELKNPNNPHIATKRSRTTIYQISADGPIKSGAKSIATRIREFNVITEEEKWAQYCKDKVESLMKDPNPSEKNRRYLQIWKLFNIVLEPEARENLIKFLGYDVDNNVARTGTGESKPNVIKKEGDIAPYALSSFNKSPNGAMKELVNQMVDASITDSERLNPNQVNGDASDFFSQQSSNLDSANNSNAVFNNNSLRLPSSLPPFKLHTGSNLGKDLAAADVDVDASITRMVLIADFASAVDICVQNERYDDALLLASCGDTDLLQRTREALLERKSSAVGYIRVTRSVLREDLSDIVESVDIMENANSWKDILVSLATYSGVSDFPRLCDVLGTRLFEAVRIGSVKDEWTTQFLDSAVVCFVLGGRIDKVVHIWLKEWKRDLEPLLKNCSPGVDFFLTKEYSNLLVELMTRIVMLRKCCGKEDGTSIFGDEKDTDDEHVLDELYARYSVLARDSGLFDVALRYINFASSGTLSKKIPFGFHIPETHDFSTDTSSASKIILVDPLELMKYNTYMSCEKSVIEKRYKNPDVGRNFPVPVCPYELVQRRAKIMEPDVFGNYQEKEQKSTVPERKQSPVNNMQSRQNSVMNPPQPYNPYQPPTGRPDVYNPYAPVNQPLYPNQPAPTNPPYWNQPQQPPNAGWPTPSPPVARAPPPVGRPVGPPVGGYNDPPNFETPNRTPIRPLVSKPSEIANVMVPKPPMAQGPPQHHHPGFSPPNPVNQPMYPDQPWNQQPNVPYPPGNSPNHPPPPMSGYQPPSQPPNVPGYNSNPGSNWSGSQPPSGYYPGQHTNPGQYVPPGPGQRTSISGGFTPVAEPPKSFPVGDRSHIPAEHKHIYENLAKCVNQCKPNANPAQKKFLDDAEKRLNELYDKLNNSDVSEGAIAQLLILAKAVEQKDWQSALGAHQSLSASFQSEGSKWIIGIKRLLDTAKALP